MSKEPTQYLLAAELKAALLTAGWFIFLTFPIMVIRVNPIEHVIVWRWGNCILVGIGSFAITLASRYLLRQKGRRLGRSRGPLNPRISLRVRLLALPGGPRLLIAAAIAALALLFPFFFSSYQTSIMTTALLYVVLGLGLNIVVGLSGLLNLGYVAFYAVGAYCYALLNHHFGIGFWLALPIGGLLAALCGILLGAPVLRLRGDYLAIVTLGFGEIIRLVLENWNEFSFGPSGIANIAKPGLFGLALSFEAEARYLYYLMIALVIATVLAVHRLQHSRIGRAWQALREDEVACEAMGIDTTWTKLSAFSLGAFWAGMAGVVFAARTSFVNPASFTFLESALILAIVVLGGMGSIAGVIAAALILILLPEYLRAFSEYRMLIFGAIMVVMMIFRPQGLLPGDREQETGDRERP